MIPQSLAAFIVDQPKENWRSFGDPSSPLLKVLCFEDEAAQIQAFAVAGFATGATRVPGVGDIDIIGVVVDQEPVFGEPDGEGFPTIVTPATFLDGWYVNVLIEEAPSAGVGLPGVDTPPQPPLSISPRQARLALLSLGLLDRVNEMVEQGPAELRIAWEFSIEVRRDDPGVIALATQLGIADQLPELFAMGATL